MLVSTAKSLSIDPVGETTINPGTIGSLTICENLPLTELRPRPITAQYTGHVTCFQPITAQYTGHRTRCILINRFVC